jgi:hypothetical protein
VTKIPPPYVPGWKGARGVPTSNFAPQSSSQASNNTAGATTRSSQKPIKIEPGTHIKSSLNRHLVHSSPESSFKTAEEEPQNNSIHRTPHKILSQQSIPTVEAPSSVARPRSVSQAANRSSKSPGHHGFAKTPQSTKSRNTFFVQPHSSQRRTSFSALVSSTVDSPTKQKKNKKNKNKTQDWTRGNSEK